MPCKSLTVYNIRRGSAVFLPEGKWRRQFLVRIRILQAGKCRRSDKQSNPGKAAKIVSGSLLSNRADSPCCRFLSEEEGT